MERKREVDKSERKWKAKIDIVCERSKVGNGHFLGVEI